MIQPLEYVQCIQISINRNIILEYIEVYSIQQMSFILLPCYATQIAYPFLNSMISANHDKVGHSANGEILKMGCENLS